MRNLSLFLFLSIIFIGCHSQKVASSNTLPTKQTNPNLTDSTIIIAFQQTGCFGSCPIQKASILKNGLVNYQGKRFVKHIGEHHTTLNNQQIQEIYNKAQKLDFFNLDSIYNSSISDLPTYKITIKTNNQNHSISAKGQYPQNLKELIQYLENYFQNIDWQEN